MPEASGAGRLPVWLASMSEYEKEDPPVQNTGYQIITEEPNVRLLMYAVRQVNDEQAAKDLEVRFVLDGNDYIVAFSALNNTQYYVYVNKKQGEDFGVALSTSLTEINCGFHCDKRALEATLEARITSAVGTNQTLEQWLIWEQLAYTTV